MHPTENKNNSPAPYPVYPPYAMAEDEINLADLWLMLAKKKYFIAATTTIITLLAVLVVLLLPRTYEANAVFLPPLAADIALFNRENINAFTVAGVYNSLISNLRSRGNRKTFFEKSGLLDEIMTTSGRETANKAAVFDGIIKAIDVELIKFSKDKKIEEKIEQVAVVLQGSPPEFLASYINGFADFALQKTLDNLIVEANSQKTEIIKTLERKIVRLKTQAKKQRLDTIAQLEEQDQIKRADLLQQISALQLKAKITREFEIQRLTEADQLEVASITEKIKALKITAKDRRLDRIKQLKEALQIAMALGIQSRSLLTSHYNTAIENNQTIKQSNNQTIKQSNNQKYDTNNLLEQPIVFTEINKSEPLYLMGEKTLSAEINELEARTTDDAFIPELRDLEKRLLELQENEQVKILQARKSDDPFIMELTNLKRQLKLLEQNATSRALKNRKDDAPFIAELRKMENELKRLKDVEFNPKLLKVARIDQYAYVPEKAIKPKRTLIVAVAFVLGLFLAIFAALVVGSIGKTHEKTEG